MAAEDPRLARLYDYTKFHIGIYIAAGTTMITILATKGDHGFLGALVKQPWVLLLAAGSMSLAGAAGGIIVSKCAVARSFSEVWRQNIGPWGYEWWPGWRWARLEHYMFWVSVVLSALALLTRWPTTGVM
jgi:hypothetical protein